MARELSFDEFQGHKAQSGSKTQYAKSWRKDGKTRRWLHMGAPILLVQQHDLPQIVEGKDDDGDRVLKLYNRSFNCTEPEAVILDQNERSRDTGARDLPPEKCPICKAVEWIFQRVRDGKVDWLAPAFRWENPQDDKKSTVLHAGGLTGIFGWKKMENQADFIKHAVGEKRWKELRVETDTDQDVKVVKRSLKKAEIRLDEAFKEDLRAKLQYAFCTLDEKDLSKGLEVTIERVSLGDKCKVIFGDEIRKNGKEDGHPHHSPYLFEWTYAKTDGAGKKLLGSEMYQAVRVYEKGKPAVPSDAVRKILEGDFPDMQGLKRAPRWSDLRKNLEGHCLIKGVPWDEFFAGLKDEEREKDGKHEKDGSFEFGANARDDDDDEVIGSDAEAALPPAQQKKKPPPAPDSEPAAKGKKHPDDDADPDDDDRDGEPEELAAAMAETRFNCENAKCGKVIDITDAKCPFCSKVYDEEAVKMVEEVKKLPTREELLARQKAAKGAPDRGEFSDKKVGF